MHYSFLYFRVEQKRKKGLDGMDKMGRKGRISAVEAPGADDTI
jgi:hypothetical protein